MPGKARPRKTAAMSSRGQGVHNGEKGCKSIRNSHGRISLDYLHPVEVFNNENGSLVIPRPIMRHEPGISSVPNTDLSSAENCSKEGPGGHLGRTDSLLTKNLRGSDSRGALSMEDSSTILDDHEVDEEQECTGEVDYAPLAISRANLEYMYLSQETVYRLMNLANIIESNGWDLENLRIDILKGTMVLVSHADQWKFRRIKSWSTKTMNIILEDNTTVWPLNLYNRLLENDDIHVDFALQEYVYQIHSKKIERYGANEVFHIFRKLIKCSRALQELLDSEQEEQIVSSLIRSLQREPLLENMSSFAKYLRPGSLLREKDLSDAYKSLIRHRDPRLQSLFSIWVQNFCIREHTADDMQETQEKTSQMIFTSKPVQSMHAIVSHSDGNHEDFKIFTAGAETASDKEDELGECTPTSHSCLQQGEKQAQDRTSPTIAWLPVFQLDHAESVNKSRVVRPGLKPAHQIVHKNLLEQRLNEDSYRTTFSPDGVHAVCKEKGEGHSLQSSPVGSSNRVGQKKGLKIFQRQPAYIGKLVSDGENGVETIDVCKTLKISPLGYSDVQTQKNPTEKTKANPSSENSAEKVSTKRGSCGAQKNCPKRKAIPSRKLANNTRKRRKGQ